MLNDDRLKSICKSRMADLGLNSIEYKKRLDYELIEIEVQEKAGYFLEHYDKGTKWEKNDHNLLVPYLLDLCPACVIKEDPASIMGEYPDIDIDFLVPVRDHLRNVWAPKVFGKDNVAFIGTYQTYNLKQSLIDMARVFGLDRHEIQSITKQFAVKDDEGEALVWDSAIKEYPAFKEWVDKNPEAADAAKMLIGRNRNMSQHAGGFIVSSIPLTGFAPLVKNKKDDSLMTAWPEGQSAQDLMEVGLVKIDTLASEMQEQIVDCVGLILNRYYKGKNGICTTSKGGSWSNDSYLNDPDALHMADKSDLRFIFQFDSDGIRKLVRQGGVSKFENLEAYSALYRPGPLNSGMHEVYCKRSRNQEDYHIHKVLEPYLKSTYGVMCLHEDTRVAKGDGTEAKIRNIQRGDLVYSYNYEKQCMEVKECHGCGPTRKSDGIRLTLSNGYTLTLTDDHKVYTYNGMKEAGLLSSDDLIAAPVHMPSTSSKLEGVSWLGSEDDVAYLLGQLTGDGSNSFSIELAVGTLASKDALAQHFRSRFPKLNVIEYFATRSWYLRLHCDELLNSPHYGNRKTRFHKMIEDMGLKLTPKYKRIPHQIMRAKDSTKLSYLAGLIESDGCVEKVKSGRGKGRARCFISSSSHDLLQDVRRLCSSLGLCVSIINHQLFIHNTYELHRIISPYLVFKKIDGKLSKGDVVGFHPKKCLFDAIKQSNMSQRKFCKRYDIARSILKWRSPHINDRTAKKIGVSGDSLKFFKIKKIEVVKDQQFYGMSVADNHNLVANGILVKNCYQEQVMQVLHAAGKVPLRDAYVVVKAISKKKIEKFSKYKDMFIENSQDVLEISEEEATELWNQIEEFAAYGFNKSHSCAYTVQSSRQLWLKCHYPLEYFCTMLNHIRGNDEKLRDCRRQAESHGVKVNPINIQKSFEEFAIYSSGEPQRNDEIYFGLANIKSVGAASARRIVELRKEKPFDGFKDFLDRFGTDSKVIQALISLRAFEGERPIKLWKYYEYYKKYTKTHSDRRKRFSLSMERYHQQLFDVAGPGYLLTETDIDRAINSSDDEEAAKKLRRIKGNFRRSVTNFNNNETAEQSMVSLEEFDDSVIPDDTIKQEILDIMYDKEKAEIQFYGFCWSNPIDNCPDSMGLTFERFKSQQFEAEQVGSVEGIIQDNKENTSKKGNKYRSIRLMDKNWESAWINVWSEEAERFKSLLKIGNIVRMRVKPPDPKFGGARYTIESWPRYMKHKTPPEDSDYRVYLLKNAEPDDSNDLIIEHGDNELTINIGKKAESILRRDDEQYL